MMALIDRAASSAGTFNEYALEELPHLGNPRPNEATTVKEWVSTASELRLDSSIEADIFVTSQFDRQVFVRRPAFLQVNRGTGIK